jgi:hypothetical protein
MSIVRAPRPISNFYILDKRLSEDKRLSWAARGLLIFLLGKPDNWQVSIANLINETAGSIRPSGRDAAYGLLRELEQAGYVTRSRPHNVEGTFASFDYIVRESPFTESQEVVPLTEKPEMVLSPLPAEPLPAEPLPANPLQTSIEVYQGLKEPNKDGGKAPPVAVLPVAKKAKAQTFAQWEASGDLDSIFKDYAPLNQFIAKTRVPWEFEGLAWRAFARRYRHDPQYSSKTYIDWRQTYLNCLRDNWFHLWRMDHASNCFVLTTQGVMAQKEQRCPTP